MVLVVSFISPPSLSTSFSPYSFPLTDNKTTRDPALPMLWVTWGLPHSHFRSASKQGGIWGRLSPLGSTLRIQLRGKERGLLSLLKIWAPPHPPKGPWCGWHPAASLVPTLARRVPGVSPATWSWGGCSDLHSGARDNPCRLPPHPFYLHPSNYATSPDPAFYPFYPGLSACSPKQAGLSRWRLL